MTKMPNDVRERGERAGRQEVLDDLHVAGEAANDAADFHLVVEERERPDHVVVHFDWQLAQDARAHPGGDDLLEV